MISSILYERKEFVPRFRLLPQDNAVQSSSDSESEDNTIDSIYTVGTSRQEKSALNTLISTDFDIANQVLIEGITGNSLQNKASSHSTFSLLSYHPERMTFRVHATESDYFLTSDTFYPGWHALVDTKEVPVLRANFISRAVPIPEGDHNLTLYFEPTYLKPGLILTAIGALVYGIILLLILLQIRKVRFMK
ncbi:MAG: YfhO family protein [bacterium]|nr:YfhO family protein [bacterium]